LFKLLRIPSFTLLEQKDVVRNRYTNYLSRVDLTKRLEARAKDRERLSDVDQGRQAEFTARNNYVNAVASFQNALDQFKLKLGLALGEKILLDDRALAELAQAGLTPTPLDPPAAYRFAVEKQLLLLSAIDRFEDLKRKVRLAVDRFKPDLNFMAEASLESERPTDYTRFDPDNIRASMRLELDLPIDRLPERNSYRSTLVSFEAELRNLTLALDNLKDDIERGLRTLEQRRQNYRIQKNALELANRRVDSTAMMLKAGRGEVRDVVDSQDAQVQAQNAVTSALVNYQVSRLTLMLDIGALETDTPKFWLKDHLETRLISEKTTPAAAQAEVQPVVPPDDFFNN
jgi:outer membrane protein TolC